MADGFAHYCNRAAGSHVRHCNPYGPDQRPLTRAIASLIPAGDAAGSRALPQEKPAEEPADRPPSITVDVSLVNILASVHDKHGGLIGNLTKDDFTILEDGKPQTIKYFTRRPTCR
jgi:hypothetical protein